MRYNGVWVTSVFFARDQEQGLHCRIDGELLWNSQQTERHHRRHGEKNELTLQIPSTILLRRDLLASLNEIIHRRVSSQYTSRALRSLSHLSARSPILSWLGSSPFPFPLPFLFLYPFLANCLLSSPTPVSYVRYPKAACSINLNHLPLHHLLLPFPLARIAFAGSLAILV